jgi:hypothetical protein
VSSIIDRIQETILAQESIILELIKYGRAFAAYEEINRMASEVSQKFLVEVVVNFRKSRQLIDFK